MLNWSIRYYPILRAIRPFLRPGTALLELGSGSWGLAYFHSGVVTGCDLSFPTAPRKNLRPVVASGTRLPFADRSFDVVVSSDMLEHVPPTDRPRVITEALRVCRRVAVFGFPSGSEAHRRDLELLAHCQAEGIPVPDWLSEHLAYELPDIRIFGIGPDWAVQSVGNANSTVNGWILPRESRTPWRQLFKLVHRVLPRVEEKLLSWADRPPYCRVIVTCQRCERAAPNTAGASPARF